MALQFFRSIKIKSISNPKVYYFLANTPKAKNSTPLLKKRGSGISYSFPYLLLNVRLYWVLGSPVGLAKAGFILAGLGL